LAADQIAGAGTMAPAAAPVTVFRKSRRFIGALQRMRGTAGTGFARFVPELRYRRADRQPTEFIEIIRFERRIIEPSAVVALHTKKMICLFNELPRRHARKSSRNDTLCSLDNL
jgi:hypothetical protein